MPCLKHTISIGDRPPPSDVLSYEELLCDAPPVDDALRGGDDVAGIYYTGGATGDPKGVALTHANMVVNALASRRNVAEDEESVYLHAAPMFHMADIAMLIGVTLGPGTHVVIPKFDTADVLRVIGQERVTITLLVPTMLGMLLSEFNPAIHDLSSLTTIVYGASPMPTSLIEQALKLMPSVGFIQAYGMTELAPSATVLEPETPFAHRSFRVEAAVGRPCDTDRRCEGRGCGRPRSAAWHGRSDPRSGTWRDEGILEPARLNRRGGCVGAGCTPVTPDTWTTTVFSTS